MVSVNLCKQQHHVLEITGMAWGLVWLQIPSERAWEHGWIVSNGTACCIYGLLLTAEVPELHVHYLVHNTVHQNPNEGCLCMFHWDHALSLCLHFSVLYTKMTWAWLEHLDLTWLNLIYYFNMISSVAEGQFLPECLSESLVSISFILGASNSFHCD